MLTRLGIYLHDETVPGLRAGGKPVSTFRDQALAAHYRDLAVGLVARHGHAFGAAGFPAIVAHPDARHRWRRWVDRRIDGSRAIDRNSGARIVRNADVAAGIIPVV